MSQVSEAVVVDESRPEPGGGKRRRTAAVMVTAAAVVVTAGVAIAVCTTGRRPGRTGDGPPVTQFGILNIASRPDVYRPVLRAGSKRCRTRRRRAQVPVATDLPQARRRGRPRE